MDGLNKEKFLEALKYLDAYFINFKFDFNDDMKCEIWYSAFKNFEFKDLQILFKHYARNNVYPPSSPSSLLEYAKKVLVNNSKGKANKAWEFITNAIVRHGFRVTKSYNPQTNKYEYFDRLQQSIDNHPDVALRKAYDAMWTRFRNLNDYNRDKIREEFIEHYERFLTEEISNNVNNGNLKLETPNNKLLE